MIFYALNIILPQQTILHKRMNQEPLLIIKAKYTKILVMFIFITIIQYVSYSYVQESIKYSFNSALILTGLSIMEFVLILLIIKNGLPQIRFFESHCIIQLYIMKIQFNYDQIESISINNTKSHYKLLPVGNEYLLRIVFKHNQNLFNLYQNTIKPVMSFSKFHLDTFANHQILEIYLLFQIIIPLDQEKRITTLKNLNLQNLTIKQISNLDDIKNFKNNHYLRKNF